MSVNNGTYEFAGCQLESPLINAAGSINGTGVEEMKHRVAELARTGIGGITVGSVTVPAQEGNEPKYGGPVFIIDEELGKTWNSMGLPNIGLDSAVTLAPELAEIAHEAGKLLILSGSPTNSPEHGTSVEQASTLAYELLATPTDLVEINVSCPNVVTEEGGRKPLMGYDLQSMEELIVRLKNDVGPGQRLGLKLPPYLTEEQMDVIPDLAKLILASNVFRFLVICNTIPNQMPHDMYGSEIPLSVPGGVGGMSGPATQPIGRNQTALWYDQTHGEIDLNSTEGVDTGYELAIRRKIGAKVGSGVTFLWRGKDWPRAVTRLLDEFADEELASQNI